MKKVTTSVLSLLFLFSCLFIFNLSVTGQETAKESPSLPDNINKIVTVSCYPCHSSTGGFMSKSKLNFSEWTQYAPEKQKDKAEKAYSKVNKGTMPPKSARTNRPETIPTNEQIDIIKIWSESFKTVAK